MALLVLTLEQSVAIAAISRTRADGGLGVIFDGTNYLCADVRANSVYTDYWPILATATVYHTPLSKRDFYLRMGKANRKQIRAILATNADVADGWEYIHTIDTVDVTDSDVIQFVNDVKTAGIWNAARVTALLTP
jgi:hypothetical protein